MILVNMILSIFILSIIINNRNPQRNDYLLANENIPQYILETPKYLFS